MGEITKALELLVDALGFELIERRPSTDPVGEIALVQLGDVLTFLTATPGGSWVLVDETLDPTGRAVDAVPAKVGGCALRQGDGPVPGTAEGGTEGPVEKDPTAACVTTLADLGYRQHVVYHGPDRFWALQWAETGLYVLLSMLLGALCFRWVRHRLS